MLVNTMDGYSFLNPGSGLGPYNPIRTVVDFRLARVRTNLLCRVVSLGQVAGTVNVQPLVSAVDSQGNAFEHGTIFGVPYYVPQAGGSAIVLVPVPGDVGIMLVCDRDITSAKQTLAPGPPQSGRSFDLSDSIYLGGLASAVPALQSITITSAGITIADANGNTIAMTAAGISITGSSVKINGVDFSTHIHSGVTTGAGDSGPPV